ncbi:hypothetical protein [Brachybacterium sp. GPGPB12]|uniref:hypothetical protein n=1 Tax=Brachybacterium sp. GPGPB12 TaxID=3023517 RepID=UPI0031345E05
MRFATTWEPVVRQRVEVASAADFAASRVGIAPRGVSGARAARPGGLAAAHGAGGARGDRRSRLPRRHRGDHRDPGAARTYPEDVRRYAIGADWTRIGQELADVGRAGRAATRTAPP